ncbi:CBM35 domain-containing protein [Polaribacter filamentus]|nr:CBM35 domain-containing protein [Polaribacter filamentus]
MASAQNDIIGKLITGYQGWFACDNGDSPENKWVHWGMGSNIPEAGNLSFELYPDMREYANKHPTGFANLGNGEPATLFGSYDTQTVDTHVRWMKEYGIDCIALQRFGSALGSSKKKAHKDGIATKIKNAAETYGRKFYMMYDISDWTNFQSEIKTDWSNTINGSLNLLAPPAYAKQNNKPVVCLWGVGSNRRPGDVTSWKDVVNWFKSQGCYVIVGGDKNWRTNVPNRPAFEAADMISPWHVGTFNASSINNWGEKIEEDIQYCIDKGIDYMPVLFPGFSWSNWKPDYENRPNHLPRIHGNFMWEQFYIAKSKFNTKNLTASVYVAMFDEFDEGTAIAKAGEDASMVPTDQYFLTLDAEGVHCSSDFYLRLTGDGAKMIKGRTPLVQNHPTPHTIPIYDNGYFLDDCDAFEGWNSKASLNSADKKQGSAGLEYTGTSSAEFSKSFSTVYNHEASVENGVLKFWYYVSDVSKFTSSGQVEIGSAGASDSSEYNWKMIGLENGWNEISLKISDAGTTGGTLDLNAINWFRIYNGKTGTVTTKVDGIYISDGGSIPAESFVLQAEDVLYSGALVSSDNPGYNGTGFVEFQNASGDYIEWVVNVAKAGRYNLTFKYALATGNSPLEMEVNGATEMESLSFSATGDWAQWETVGITNQALNAGINTVRLTTVGSGGANIDELVVEYISTLSIPDNLDIETNQVFSIRSYPNPFSSETTIAYQLTESSNVTIDIYNIYGQKVMSMSNNEQQSTGEHSKIWKPTDSGKISSGVYICNIQVTNANGTEKKSHKLNFIR